MLNDPSLGCEMGYLFLRTANPRFEMIENSEITHLDSILMDGCLRCLALGPAEILHESINLQGLSHDTFFVLFNSTQLKGE